MGTDLDRAARSGSSLVRQLGGFAWRTLRGFVGNGGVVLVGALAYNGLLSVMPLFLLAAAIFARFVDRERFIAVVTREVRDLVPRGAEQPLTDALLALLKTPYSGGVVGLLTLIFFSTLGFRTLQHALDVIFIHRRETHDPRPMLASIAISLAYVLALGVASLLQAAALMGLHALPFLADRIPRSAGPLGMIGMALALSSIYLVMPLGKGNPRAALVGGFFATLLWQGLQRAMVWYFANVSSVNLIYGSLSAIFIVLLSFEVAAAIVLLAAQVIAEIEKSWKAGRRWYEPPG
jgi:membrane protein